MSRGVRGRRPSDRSWRKFAKNKSAKKAARHDGAHGAQDIAFVALDLAKRARAAGLTTLGHQLEIVALEIGAQAAAGRWPDEAPGH
jgi:hypothetical protein